MSKLAQESFEAFGSDTPKATDEEKSQLGQQIPDWQVVTLDGEEQLRRTYKFKNFVQALAFANQVGDLAEEVDHHPVVIVEYGKTTVRWWSHAIHGLHKNDFVMAARTDEAYNAG